MTSSKVEANILPVGKTEVIILTVDCGQRPPSKSKQIIQDQVELFRKAIPDESIKIIAFDKRNAPTVSVLSVGEQDTLVVEADSGKWAPKTIKDWSKQVLDLLSQLLPSCKISLNLTNKGRN